MSGDLPMKEYRRAGLRDHEGESRRLQVALVATRRRHLGHPFGPPVRGWQEVSDRLDLAASNYRDGRDYEFENIATVIAPELAYTVEIERIRARVGGADELTQIAIRDDGLSA